MAFLADNQAFMRVWYIIIYLVFGVSLIFLSLALYERLKAGSPALAQAVTTFGLIYAVLVIVIGTLSINNLSTVVKLYGENPAQAATVWLTLNSVETGLGGGGGETIVNALWFLLAKLGSLAGKGASQGIELPWRGDRCSWHPLGCPDLACPDGCCLWIGSYHLVRLARDRHAAQTKARQRKNRMSSRNKAKSKKEKKMKICIVGASGKLGTYMVQHALDRGYEVVGVCRERSVSKLDAFKGRITVIPGATNDRAGDPAGGRWL